MASVTQRIKEIKQPRGGYINISEFDIKNFNDGKTLNENENIHASVIGMVVDYMTRFIMGADKKEAFKISIMGSVCAEKLGNKNAIKEFKEYFDKINNLDHDSIIYACKVVTYDVWYRNPMTAPLAKGPNDIIPDEDTIENIIILINRSIDFWNNYGPIKADGFTFENGGYTDIVDSGDGDYLTEDTLWDFKVSKTKPKPDNTLQIVMYYIMGKHSGKKEFDSIEKIGIFNPRLNTAYIKKVSDIPEKIMNEISYDIIGYNKNNKSMEIENNKKYEMAELMKLFSCTRYKIMKLYSERGLPLKKEKNKYFIYEQELEMWIEEQKRMQKQRMIISIVFIIAFLIIMFIIIKNNGIIK